MIDHADYPWYAAMEFQMLLEAVELNRAEEVAHYVPGFFGYWL